MIINKIQNLDQLNTLCCEQFTDSIYNWLVHFDILSAYVINEGIYSNLRSFLDNDGDYSDYLDHLQDSYPSVNFDEYVPTDDVNDPYLPGEPYVPALAQVNTVATYELYAPANDNCTYFFFPYSKKEFISAFYYNVTPVLLESILDLMKSTGRLVQIGGGSGKAMVIKCQPFTETHLSHFPQPIDPSHAIQSITNLLSSLSSSFSNDDFYVNYISKQDEIISHLNSRIEQLENKVNSIYQTTWR